MRQIRRAEELTEILEALTEIECMFHHFPRIFHMDTHFPTDREHSKTLAGTPTSRKTNQRNNHGKGTDKGLTVLESQVEHGIESST